MGRRGPPPKPTRLKVIAGNPGKYPLNHREPQPRKAVPRCPDWLPDEAKTEWRWMVRELAAMGLLTSVDKHALIVYCQTWVRWRTAEDFIQKHGESYPLRGADDKIKCFQPFPQVATARSLVTVLKSYQQEFGLTPASRSRISLPDQNGHVSDTAKRFFGS